MLTGGAQPVRDRESVRVGLGLATIAVGAAAITFLPVWTPIVIAVGLLSVAALNGLLLLRWECH